MPTWLIILLSEIAGVLIVGAALAAAFWPELRARPKKSWMADPSGNVDDYRYGGMGGDHTPGT